MTDRQRTVEALIASPLVEAHQLLQKGHLRLQTPFHYPDGSKIDVFVHRDLDAAGNVVLTDFGATANWLSMLGIGPELGERRLSLLEGIESASGLQRNKDALERVVRKDEDPIEPMIQLASGCIRFADLMFTRKTQELGDFKDRLESSLIDYRVVYQTKATLIGRRDRPVEIDFLVQGRTLTSAVFAMAAKNPANARTQARSTFAKVHDLGLRPEQRVVLYDDQGCQWPDEEIERFLEIGSVAFAYSEHDQWRPLVAA